MSANSLNRYTPVPPISPTQPLDQRRMSDLNISGGAAVFSKPPVVKCRSSNTARTTDADCKEKVSDADVKIETQFNGDAAKEVMSAAATDGVEHKLVQSEEGSVVRTKDEDASLNGNAVTAAAVEESDDDEHVSVSFIVPVYCILNVTDDISMSS